MKPAVLLFLLLVLCLLLAGCQSASFSDVLEAATEKPTATPIPRPTLSPNASDEEKRAFYRNAVEDQERAVSFSAEDGFYTKDLSLTLSTEGTAEIFYTDDGSDPDYRSLQYTHALPLSATDADLPRCAVIRAVAYYPDGTKSPVFTHSYFLNTKIKKRFSTPVFSIIASPEELTTGPSALLVGSRALDTGEYAYRTIRIQLFLSDGTKAFDQPSTLRVYGEASRNTPVKSLLLTAGTGEEAEEQFFPYALFDTSNFQGETMEHYKKVVLSSAEDDFQYAFIRDEFAQSLAKAALFQDYEDVRPVVVYINGEYYGLHWLHEYYSNDFFQALYGMSEGRYAVIQWTEESGAVPMEKADQEAAEQFQAAYEQILAADLNTEEGLALVRRLLDVENYLDYCALNILIDNENWPSQMQAYAYITAKGDAQWRFLPHAMSNSFGLKDVKNAAGNDTLGDALNPDSSRYAPLFAKLMDTQEYREYFTERLTALLEEQWSKDVMLSILKELHNARNSEMQYYFSRIDALRKMRNSGVWMKKKDFETAYSDLTNYVKNRFSAVTRQLEQHLSQEEPADDPESEPETSP